jgi:hypothetical protein
MAWDGVCPESAPRRAKWISRFAISLGGIDCPANSPFCVLISLYSRSPFQERVMLSWRSQPLKFVFLNIECMIFWGVA